MVHQPAVIPQQRQGAAIAITPVLGGIVNDGRSQPHLVIGLGGLITLGRPRLPITRQTSDILSELRVKIIFRYFSLAFLIMGIYSLNQRLPKRMGLPSCKLIR